MKVNLAIWLGNLLIVRILYLAIIPEVILYHDVLLMQEPSIPCGDHCTQSDDDLPKIDLGGKVCFFMA